MPQLRKIHLGSHPVQGYCFLGGFLVLVFFFNDCFDFLSCKAFVQLCSFFLIQLQKVVCFSKFIHFLQIV